MLVSEVKVKLSGQDILGIVKEFVKLEDLKINNIEINEFLDVEGVYEKGLKVPFKVTVAIGSIYDNKLSLKITSAKIYKIGVFTSIKNFALKKAILNMKQQGIEVKEDNLILDLNILLKQVPYVEFNLKYVNLIKEYIEVIADKLDFSMDKKAEPQLKEEEAKEEEIEVDIDSLEIEKIKDGYTTARETVKNKVPDKYKKAVNFAIIVPDILALLYRLFKDKRVKLNTKIAVGASIAYLASPLDVIPDKIPFVGKVDDVAIAFFALNKIINEVPINVVLENWEGKNNIIVVLKEALAYLNKLSGGTNVDKLYRVVEKLA